MEGFQFADRRTSMACTSCRARKIKCKTASQQETCDHCNKKNILCLYKPVDSPGTVPTPASVPDTVPGHIPHYPPHQNAHFQNTTYVTEIPYENSHYSQAGSHDAYTNELPTHSVQSPSNPAPDNQYRGSDPRGHPSSQEEFLTGNQSEFSPPLFSGDQHMTPEYAVYPDSDSYPVAPYFAAVGQPSGHNQYQDTHSGNAHYSSW